MHTAQANKLFAAAIYSGPKVQTAASRSKARSETKDAKVAALNEAIQRIRAQAREMPAWERGYFSAITSIELLVKEIEAAA